MDTFEKIIKDWHNSVGNELNQNNRVCYMIGLFVDLINAGFDKEEFSEKGPYILGLISPKTQNDYVNMVLESIVAMEIQHSYKVSSTFIPEYEEDVLEIDEKGVSNKVYEDAEESEEFQVDLRNADIKIQEDLSFLNSLKVSESQDE